MSYTALYRKFRPDNLSDVKGQEAIVKTLSNQIMMGRIGHAYLFCGTRGTGKTTVAKILARAVNCEHPTENGPCGECASCRAIAAGNSMNVMEIDAASNNGVDNVREIRDEVAYAPTEGRYKVYIIDEVHMLSGSAFNALLKTLEEPPAYVIFILATTEPHKLPATILSRCQRYDFKRIPIGTIVERMRELLTAEKVSADDSALNYIARAADGGMRDALSILDQCIAFYPGQTISYNNVMEVLGTVDSSTFGELFAALAQKDVAESLRILDDVISNGREVTQFITDFTWHLRNLLLVSNTTGSTEIPGIPEESLPELKKQAALTNSNSLVKYIRILSELINEIKFSPQKRVLTEIAIVKLCRPEVEGSLTDLNDRLCGLEMAVSRMERGIASGNIGTGIGDSGKTTSPDIYGNGQMESHNPAEGQNSGRMESHNPTEGQNSGQMEPHNSMEIQESSDEAYDDNTDIQAYYPEEDSAGYISGYEAMFADGSTAATSGRNNGGENRNSNSSISRADADELIRRIEKLEKALRNRPMVSSNEEAAPIAKPELPAAVPEDVEKVVKNFRGIVKEMDPIWKACIDNATLSLSKNGNLLMVFPNGDTGVGFCKRHKEHIEDFISAQSGVKLHIEYEELPPGRDSDDMFVDLEKIIKMPIEIEEQ